MKLYEKESYRTAEEAADQGCPPGCENLATEYCYKGNCAEHWSQEGEEK